MVLQYLSNEKEAKQMNKSCSNILSDITELQIRWIFEDNSERIFLNFSMKTYAVTPN